MSDSLLFSIILLFIVVEVYMLAFLIVDWVSHPRSPKMLRTPTVDERWQSRPDDDNECGWTPTRPPSECTCSLCEYIARHKREDGATELTGEEITGCLNYAGRLSVHAEPD